MKPSEEPKSDYDRMVSAALQSQVEYEKTFVRLKDENEQYRLDAERYRKLKSEARTRGVMLLQGNESGQFDAAVDALPNPDPADTQEQP